MPVLDNARHERFCQALVEGLSQVDAYARAGFERHEGNASRLSRNEKVVARVAALQAEAAEVACLTRSWVLARLMRNAERSMQAVPVLDGEGNETGEYKHEANAANRALELLGKEQGMFVERLETNVVPVVARKPLTPDEWAAEHGAEQRTAH